MEGRPVSPSFKLSAMSCGINLVKIASHMIAPHFLTQNHQVRAHCRHCCWSCFYQVLQYCNRFSADFRGFCFVTAAAAKSNVKMSQVLIPDSLISLAIAPQLLLCSAQTQSLHAPSCSCLCTQLPGVLTLCCAAMRLSWLLSAQQLVSSCRAADSALH
jgi:hypothetical protein